MDVVTYLLGAGASAQCLPVVKDLFKRIQIISHHLRNLNNKHKFNITIPFTEHRLSETQQKLLKNICEDLEWMAAACQRHSSIDTFAKKLFILKSDDYKRLKIILSVYFTIEQKINSPDLRYDNFWASIINSKNVFPQNLRIISWNYDFQLEQSYLNFSDDITLQKSYNTLSVRSFCDSKRDISAEDFAIYKLNGSATISQNEGRPTYFSDEILNDTNFYDTLLNRYSLLKNDSDYSCNLSFAWEHNLSNSYFQELKLSLWNTKTLVIIGYSFPYFNNKIDKFLVNECMPFLEKVYFQAPDAINLKERFTVLSEDEKHIKDNKLVLRNDLEQFTFPNEL